MEETGEVLEIVRPSSKPSNELDSKVAEMHDVAQGMAKKNGEKMAVIKIPGGFEIKPASKGELEAANQAPLSKFEPPVKPLIASEPTLEPTIGKSQGKPWSNHVSKHGIPGGPGRYRKG